MTNNIRAQYDALENAINTLKGCFENIRNTFEAAKKDYEEMNYASEEATKLKEIFNTDTVSDFNKCCNDIANYIKCLETTKQEYLLANEASLN